MAQLAQRKLGKQKTFSYLSLHPFKGMNIQTTSTQIDNSESPDMLNVTLDDDGAIDKRSGYTTVIDFVDGGGVTIPKAVNGIFTYKKITGDINLAAFQTAIYTIDYSAETYAVIYTGIADSQVRGFTFTDYFYFLDGVKYLVYDGTTVSEVVGKIPTITIGTPPAGGGTLFEQLNLISAGFTQRYDGDGATVAYNLALANLDATTVTATVEGIALTEGVGFTVNRTTGVVTFSVAPLNSEDNCVITAYKTTAGNRAKIEKCKQFAVYGGNSDSRVILTGNTDELNVDYISGVYDATYFPINGFYTIGDTGEAITAYEIQYNTLVVFKEYSQHIRKVEIDTDGDVTFPTQRLNKSAGAYTADSVQLVENNPMYLDRKGVYVTKNTSIEDERNVEVISLKVNRNIDNISSQGILDVDNLEYYKSIDYDRKYWLVNSNTGIGWIYDYDIKQWLKFDNIYANNFLMLDNELLFGDSRKGKIYKFQDQYNTSSFNDDGSAITAYWRSKLLNFGTGSFYKNISELFFTIKSLSTTSAKVSVRSDINSVFEVLRTVTQTLFQFSTLVFSTLSFSANIFPLAFNIKLKQKKTNTFQIEIRNDVLDESFGLLELNIKYLVYRTIRR